MLTNVSCRFSKPYQDFLCNLTATFVGEGLLRAAECIPGASIHPGPRGSPLNVGSHLEAIHPVVRTHPVTQKNSLFAAGLYAQRINEVHPEESDELLRKFNRMIMGKQHHSNLVLMSLTGCSLVGMFFSRHFLGFLVISR